jgi:hypothetical protein
MFSTFPTPDPGIADLLKSPQFGGTPAPPPVTAGLGHAFATALANLAARPAAAALPPPPAAAPAAPAARAVPALPQPLPPPPSPELTTALARALADPESNRLPIAFTVEKLDALGADAATLEAAAAMLGLHIAPNFDGRGGSIVARTPDILQAAVETRGQLRPVRVIFAQVPQPRRRAGGRRVR